MTDSQQKRTLFVLDEFESNGWIQIRILTNHELLMASVELFRRNSLLSELSSGSDPLEALKTHLPSKPYFRSIPLSMLEYIQCYSDLPITTIEYYDSQSLKHRKECIKLSDVKSQEKLLAGFKAAAAKFDFSVMPASALYTGGQQIVYGVIAVLVFGGVALAGYCDPTSVKLDRIGRGRALGELYVAVGSTGFVAIGMAIVLLMAIWWAIKCINPPMKSTLRFHRNVLS